MGPQGLLVRIFGPAGPAPDISRAWRSATVHRRPSRASRRRWPLWACCCPSVDFLLLFGAADTCAACSASVARSCRARWRTCAEGTTRPPAKPGLLLASVSTDASALFFFAFFALLLFFCWRLGIAAGAAGTRLGCHLALLQWWFTFYTPEARRNTGKQNASARARQRRLLFLGPRQDEAAKYLSVNFTRRPVPRGSFRGLLARRTTRPTRGLRDSKQSVEVGVCQKAHSCITSS